MVGATLSSTVCEAPEASRRDINLLLNDQIEAVVVRAKQHGLTLDEVQSALRNHWKNL